MEDDEAYRQWLRDHPCVGDFSAWPNASSEAKLTHFSQWFGISDNQAAGLLAGRDLLDLVDKIQALKTEYGRKLSPAYTTVAAGHLARGSSERDEEFLRVMQTIFMLVFDEKFLMCCSSSVEVLTSLRNFRPDSRDGVDQSKDEEANGRCRMSSAGPPTCYRFQGLSRRSNQIQRRCENTHKA